MTTPAAAAPETSNAHVTVGTGTAYHIFQEVLNAGSPTYEPVQANVKASSGAAAIKATVKTAGTYVAVPARSWTPTKVTLEQTTVVKLQ